jgi:hypothetical protein
VSSLADRGCHHIAVLGGVDDSDTAVDDVLSWVVPFVRTPDDASATRCIPTEAAVCRLVGTGIAARFGHSATVVHRTSACAQSTGSAPGAMEHNATPLVTTALILGGCPSSAIPAAELVQFRFAASTSASKAASPSFVVGGVTHINVDSTNDDPAAPNDQSTFVRHHPLLPAAPLHHILSSARLTAAASTTLEHAASLFLIAARAAGGLSLLSAGGGYGCGCFGTFVASPRLVTLDVATRECAPVDVSDALNLAVRDAATAISATLRPSVVCDAEAASPVEDK